MTVQELDAELLRTASRKIGKNLIKDTEMNRMIEETSSVQD